MGSAMAYEMPLTARLACLIGGRRGAGGGQRSQLVIAVKNNRRAVLILADHDAAGFHPHLIALDLPQALQGQDKAQFLQIANRQLKFHQHPASHRQWPGAVQKSPAGTDIFSGGGNRFLTVAVGKPGGQAGWQIQGEPLLDSFFHTAAPLLATGQQAGGIFEDCFISSCIQRKIAVLVKQKIRCSGNGDKRWQ